jgi:hypothetical protein
VRRREGGEAAKNGDVPPCQHGKGINRFHELKGNLDGIFVGRKDFAAEDADDSNATMAMRDLANAYDEGVHVSGEETTPAT